MKTNDHKAMDIAPRRAVIRSLLPILAGVLAGVGSSVFLSRAPAAAVTPPAASVEASAEGKGKSAPPSAAPAFMASRLSAVEQRVADLSAKAEDKEAPAQRPDANEQLERQERLSQAFEKRIQKHEAAPVNPVFAASAKASLEPAMAAIGKNDPGRGELKGIDCRTDSCLATIEFPSFHAARDGFGGYVSNFYEVNCERTTTLNPPDDPSAPYAVKVMFEGCQHE